MYKALCIAVLVLPTFALGQGSKPSSATTYSAPQIVAKGKLPDQTAPISTTAIYTPKETGLFRLSVYATITKPSAGSQSFWSVNAGWVDDGGSQTAYTLLYQYSCCQQQFITYASSGPGGVTFPFEAVAGTAITYTVTQSGAPDGSAYSLYYTLERVE